MDAPGTLLVTLTGRDRPGVTAALLEAVRHHPATVLDIEQLVVRGRLVLALLLGVTPDAVGPVRDACHRAATGLGMAVESVPGAIEARAPRLHPVHVTVMGTPVRPGALAELTTAIAERGGNIDRIRRVAEYPVTAVVLEVSGTDADDLRRALTRLAPGLAMDIAVQSAGLSTRGPRLIVMDVDSTLIQDEVIDLLAEEAGVGQRVADITESAMRGDIDFGESLRARVEALAGLDAAALDRVRGRLRLTPGARTLCRTLQRVGFHVCLVSGGFEEVVRPLAEDLGVDRIRANRLVVADGRLTGELSGPIVDRAGKRQALEEFAAEFGVPMRRTIAIGDGANDLDMLAAAGLGVAFNAKPAVRDAADTALSAPYLDSVLYLLGVTRDEVEQADVEDGLEVTRPPLP